MISPSPTTPVPPGTFRGVLVGVAPAAGARPEHVRLSMPNTSYVIYARFAGPLGAAVGKRILGTLRGTARRVDVVETGGRYIEPVEGFPRRIQGTVIAGDDATNTLTINAGAPIHCALTDPRQKASAFAPGTLVATDLVDGVEFVA